MADLTAPASAAAPAVSPSPAPAASAAPAAPIPVVTAPVAVVSPTPAPTPAPAATAPTAVASTAPAAPKTSPAADLLKAAVAPGATAPVVPAAAAPETDVANLPQSPAAPVAPAKLKGLPDPAPFRFVEVDPASLDEGKLVEAVTQARELFAAEKHPFGGEVAHPDYPAKGFLQGYDSVKGKIRILFPDADPNPIHAVDFPVAELFDPSVALNIYRQLTTPAPAAPAPAEAAKTPGALSGVASAFVATALAIFALFSMSACGTTTGVAPAPSASQTAPAKIGTIVKAVETPAVVQAEAQVATAEILQRAVATGKQATVAGWATCISRGFMDEAGTANPSVADLTAAIEKETGPVTDPEFPIILASATDLWTVVKAAIPPGSSAATTELYLYAAAAGVQAGSAGYLPPATASVNWLLLKRRHEAYLYFRREAFLRPRQPKQ